MSGANISAEQASYDAIRKAVSSLQADINALTGQVRNEVASVIGSWQGGTSQAFNSVMNDWNEGSNRATTALTEFERSLSSVGAQAIQNEEDSERAVQQTAGAVNLNA